VGNGFYSPHSHASPYINEALVALVPPFDGDF